MPRSVDMSERGIRWLESRGRIAGADIPPIEVYFYVVFWPDNNFCLENGLKFFCQTYLVTLVLFVFNFVVIFFKWTVCVKWELHL